MGPLPISQEYKVRRECLDMHTGRLVLSLQEKLERERRRADVESRAGKMMDHLTGKVCCCAKTTLSKLHLLVYD